MDWGGDGGGGGRQRQARETERGREACGIEKGKRRQRKETGVHATGERAWGRGR